MRMTLALVPLIVLHIFISSASTWQLHAQTPDWFQWRGPNRDGQSAETGLLKEWPAGGPKLLWRATGAGTGYSSFSSSNGRLYTLGVRGDTEFVMAFDAATGQ